MVLMTSILKLYLEFNFLNNMYNTLNKNLMGHNRRVGCLVGQCSLFESSDSNGWSVCCWRDRSDPAAHAKLLAQSQQEKSF